MGNIVFANPWYFLLFLTLIPMVVWYVMKNHKTQATIQVSNTEAISKIPVSYKVHLRHALFVLRLLVIALLIIILARPQSSKSWQNSTTQGIDIIIALDVSSSMLAQDFRPNRLVAAKENAIEFIANRPNDRIGLVVFSGESYTQCPLTTDHSVLVNVFKDVNSGIIDDGTAIGLGLANAINRLKESNAKSKVIILLTDGVNNMGQIAPLTAAEIAQKYGIRVYTIGVGNKGFAPYPVQTPLGVQMQNIEVEIDEEVLTGVANGTNGKYYRASNNKELKEIYTEIDKLEKTKIDKKEYSKREELYFGFAVFAALFLFLEILLRNTFLRNIP